MAKVHVVLNDRQKDEVMAVALIDKVTMGEEIRRSITTRFLLKRLALHGKQIMVYDPVTGRYTSFELN